MKYHVCHNEFGRTAGRSLVSGRSAVWQNCWQIYPQDWSVWQNCWQVFGLFGRTASRYTPRVGQFGRTAGRFPPRVGQFDRTAYRSTSLKGLVSLTELLCAGRPTPQGLVSLAELPTKLISVKLMYCPYYFYTNLNFQRPISRLILIRGPLKFSYTKHHFTWNGNI